MTSRITLSNTNLSVYPLCLGGNVFGWSANEDESFAVLDAYFNAGGNFIDTADVYSEWKPGNKGGESESIIGNWMKARNNRHEMVIATKVSKLSTRPGLSAANIRAALDDSLRRLQTDHIDLYYSHEDDQSVPLEEALGAYGEVIASGKVHVIGASNYSGNRLREAAQISKTNNLPAYVVVQNQYNIMDRQPFEGDVAPAVAELGMTSLPYYGLARGFLTGKYRPGVVVESARAVGAAEYQTDRGWAVLAKLEEIAKELNTTLSTVALGWLRGHGSVPIASARTVEQGKEIFPIIDLSANHLAALDSASAL
jgi:aryl-alcohol dehydrogenase-like predicted oxidoreductase